VSAQQREYAEVLADELNDAGHDDLSVLDILDALATAGLELVKPRRPGDVPRAYADSLIEEARRRQEGEA
jgi:hypothetical protein